MDSNLTVVSIGASAGGIKAVQDFLAAVPEDSGMAFVVILHLSPDHESHLAEVLQQHSTLPVQAMVDGERVEHGRVYVLPPHWIARLVERRIELTPRPPGPNLPIDHFMLAAAQDCGAQLCFVSDAKVEKRIAAMRPQLPALEQIVSFEGDGFSELLRTGRLESVVDLVADATAR